MVPGKYHRTYLKADLQTAFEKMQEEKGVASNAYIAAAVRAALERDGYFRKRELIVGEAAAAIGRRARRAR